MRSDAEEPQRTSERSTLRRQRTRADQRTRLHHTDWRPHRSHQLTRRFQRLLDGAGVRQVRFHDLRHTTATLLLEQGVDLVVIKELLGHAHIGVTADVYAHVRLNLQHQAINTLSTSLCTEDQ
ncbi:tyrosine-type recombinase/integrase [Streptomyces sp. NPDC049881]|uniref:tyrosine-type recombinase/integrase n=1 Tax=Streptomyces sp. NPDC049881 TaxID=3155778 RepID=UPI00342091CB